MPVKNIPLAESNPAQRRAYAIDFLNLQLPNDATDADVSSALARAEPGKEFIFVLEAEQSYVEPTRAIGAAPADQPNAQQQADHAAAADKLHLRPEEINRPLAGTLGKNDPRATINIPRVETDDANARQEVDVGVNGVAWQIQRGVDVSLPWRVIEAMQNAVADTVRHDGEGEVVVTKTARVPFQFIEKPTPASIERWHQETDALFCA